MNGIDYGLLTDRIKQYSPGADFNLLARAVEFAAEAHGGQTRESGEEYISHPLAVAYILAEMQMDLETICAAILHDVVEDTGVSLAEITTTFGTRLAKLVDGVTKLSRLDFKNKREQQAETLRKMFLAMAEDLRVILIKLADRLHNMRTLKFRPPDRQKPTARETLDIFAPLANRLGISRMQWELEDLALKYLEPVAYEDIATRVAAKRQNREEVIERALFTLGNHLAAVDVRAEMQGRPKHFYSIYRKMLSGKSFDEIYDLIALRVIVDSVKDCYEVLGVVHSIWRPIPGRFKDFIANPKPNLYRSLHTTIVGEQGEPLELQIRTFEMHHIAEHGVAAHWAYKEGAKPEKELSTKLAWLRSLLEWQKDFVDPEEFVEGLKIDLFVDEVFVFTPKGDIVDLPVGSIPLDFAYRVHTDIGHRCVGAKVSGRIVPLTYELKTGDIVEIITTKQTNGPSRDWLKLVRTPQARSKIRQWFKKEQKAENVERGREMLAKEVHRQGYPVEEILVARYLGEISLEQNYLSEDDLLANIGYGGVSAMHIANRLIPKFLKDHAQAEVEVEIPSVPVMTKQSALRNEVQVVGLENALVRLASCCSPLPGDEIVGFVTRGRGVSVHTANCPNVSSLAREPERLINVKWSDRASASYQVRIEFIGMNRPGILRDVTQALAELKTDIASMQARSTKEKEAHLKFTIIVRDLAHCERVLAKLQKLRDALSVKRMASIVSKGEDAGASGSATSQ
ncbi:MAG: GTP pyrophosphokinase [Firmicutes bacterium]|nr:GTP pyrophosphokinase [Bacillota bacterium]